jgi:unsaturated rhamnogalacturonyl hydrolase
LLDVETYGPPLAAAWNGLTHVAVRSDGFLGWVQSTGAAPCTARGPLSADAVPDFEDFGVGAFLLAGSEVLRLGMQRGEAQSSTR